MADSKAETTATLCRAAGEAELSTIAASRWRFVGELRPVAAALVEDKAGRPGSSGVKALGASAVEHLGGRGST